MSCLHKHNDKLVSNQNIEKVYKTFEVSEQNKEHLIECLRASENTHFKGEKQDEEV